MVGPAGELCKMQDLSTAENQILSGKIHRAHVQGCSVRGIHMPCTALLRQGRKLLPSGSSTCCCSALGLEESWVPSSDAYAAESPAGYRPGTKLVSCMVTVRL